METVPAKLRTKVREICSEIDSDARVDVNSVFERVSRLYPKLVENEKARLFREALGGWIRSAFHKDTSKQMILPLKLSDLDMPDRIAVRPEGKRSGPAAWVSMEKVTYAELDRKVQSMEPRSRPDRQRVALRATRDFLKPHMAESAANKAIGPVLVALARADIKQSATTLD